MQENEHKEETLKKISGLYQDWFLDYASYVILDRAIPSVYDGFKPVQARTEEDNALYARAGRRQIQ